VVFVLRAVAVARWEDVLDHGSIKGFPSYGEANKLLESWLHRYPGYLERRSVGLSFENRTMHAYVLGSRSVRHSRGSVPQVLLTSLMHAREPASLTVVLYYLGHSLALLTRGDPQTLYLVETREVWLVPFVNPDGYVANEGLGKKLVRKNLRPTCLDQASSGVDLNRNFAFHWKKNTLPCNEEFQGARPFSEPETQAIKRLCEENHFRAAMNFHSFGGMLTHPFNWAEHPLLPTDDQRVYDEFAAVFGWQRFGPAKLTVGYTTTGESDDWMYGVHNIISMSPEVGPESGDFWPPPHEIKGISQRNFGRILYVVQKSGLELNISWAQSMLQKEPPALPPMEGGLPKAVLELTLRNSGLTASAGESLSIAVSGATAVSRRAVNESRLGAAQARVLADGKLLAAKVAAANSSMPGALTFQAPPLSRRSSSRFQLLLGRSWEPTGTRELRVCMVEVTLAVSATPVCHCSSGLTELPVPPDAHKTELQRSVFVRASPRSSNRTLGLVAHDDAALCALAIASAGHQQAISSQTVEQLVLPSSGSGEVVPPLLDRTASASPKVTIAASLAFMVIGLTLAGCLVRQLLPGLRPWVTASMHRQVEGQLLLVEASTSDSEAFVHKELRWP